MDNDNGAFHCNHSLRILKNDCFYWVKIETRFPLLYLHMILLISWFSVDYWNIMMDYILISLLCLPFNFLLFPYSKSAINARVQPGIEILVQCANRYLPSFSCSTKCSFPLRNTLQCAIVPVPHTFYSINWLRW